MGIETGPLLKLVFGGTMFSNEEWACSLHLVGVQDGDLPGGTDLTPLIAPLTDWFRRSSSMIPAGRTLDYAKLNQIARGPVGKLLPGGKQDPLKATNEIIFPAPVDSLTGILAVPGQLTSVVTVHTDLTRGRASKGRFYPPSGYFHPGVTVFGTDGRVTVPDAKGMADSAQELLSEINALTDIGGPLRAGMVPKCVVCVWSSVAQVARGVERVSVGRVVDTQRRRAASLDEDRQFATANV